MYDWAAQWLAGLGCGRIRFWRNGRKQWHSWNLLFDFLTNGSHAWMLGLCFIEFSWCQIIPTICSEHRGAGMAFDQCMATILFLLISRFQSMSYVRTTSSQSQPGCLLMDIGKSDQVHEISFLLRRCWGDMYQINTNILKICSNRWDECFTSESF